MICTHIYAITHHFVVTVCFVLLLKFCFFPAACNLFLLLLNMLSYCLFNPLKGHLINPIRVVMCKQLMLTTICTYSIRQHVTQWRLTIHRLRPQANSCSRVRCDRLQCEQYFVVIDKHSVHVVTLIEI